MKKSTCSEVQIVSSLEEVETGAKFEFSGMTVSHLALLRQLQDENAKLKRMYADLALMRHASRTSLTESYGPGVS